VSFELGRDEPTCAVVAALPHETSLRSERGRPRGDVRSLASSCEVNLGVGIAPDRERTAEAHRHVEREVAERADKHSDNPKIRDMEGEQKRGSIRSFLIGGLVGASAVAATLDRRRRIQRRRGRPRGLAAFESAPCYLELLEDEREREPSAS
jgi:hypothetical protein